MKRYTLMLFVLVASTLGCTNTLVATVRPIPSNNQQVYVKDGTDLLVSEKTHQVIATSVTSPSELTQNPIFGIVVRNGSDKDIYFSIDDIRAFYGKRPIKVFSREESVRYLDWQERHETSSQAMNVYFSNVGVPNHSMRAASLLNLSNNLAINQRFSSAKRMVLRGTIVPAEEGHGGIIMLQNVLPEDDGKIITLFVRVGSEVHVFEFLLKNT